MIGRCLTTPRNLQTRRQRIVSILWEPRFEVGAVNPPYLLKTLGSLRLEGGRGAEGAVRALRRKERLLLAYLARRSPAAVRRAELAALLWGTRDEASARHSLRQALFSLRRLLGDALAADAEVVRLEPGSVALDLNELEEEVRLGRTAAALARWSGDFLADLEDVGDEPLRDWIEAERTGLRRLLARALDSVLAEAQHTGLWEEPILLARRWTDAYPGEEAGHARLVTALRDAGRSEAAVACHARAQERLRTELGVAPSAGFLRLGAELEEQLCPEKDGPVPGPPAAGLALAADPSLARPVEGAADDAAGLSNVVPAQRGRWRGSRRLAEVAAGVSLLLIVVLALTLGPSDVGENGAADTIAARALFEEGLRVYYRQGSASQALELFTAALERDSGFAMAAYYGALSSDEPGQRIDLFERAERLAGTVGDRDRLLITAHVAAFFNDPRAAVIAETLATRYPADAAAAIQLGTTLVISGRFTEGVAHLQRALTLAPPSPGTGPEPCLACDAYVNIVAAYWQADSLEAAVRTARQWAMLQPHNPAPLAELATLLERLGRHEEATAVHARVTVLAPGEASGLLWHARHSLHRGDYRDADDGLEYLARSADAEIAREALWLQVISFRAQRRYTEAHDAAVRLRALANPSGPPVHPFATPEAVVRLETGDAASAAAMYDTMLHTLPDQRRPSRAARDQAWLLTLQAAALAAAGDTARLGQLADSVQIVGKRSGYARDPLLHHHVRGLLYRARGDLPRAEAAFRAAMFSSTAGYTRTNFEMARLLIEIGRPAEAIPLLEAALRAPLDGPALYVTRPELHSVLGDALAAAGRPDDAAASYGLARAAWQHSE